MKFHEHIIRVGEPGLPGPSREDFWRGVVAFAKRPEAFYGEIASSELGAEESGENGERSFTRVVRFQSGGLAFEERVVLAGYYSDAHDATSQSSDVFYRRFSDGTELFYDRKAHKLSASVQGDVECTVKGSASLTAEGAVMIESSSRISLKAPSKIGRASCRERV